MLTDGITMLEGGALTNFPPASTTEQGVITVGAQSLAGVKTFVDGATLHGIDVPAGNTKLHIVALGSNTIDCSLGNYFTRTISANSTFAFSNVPVSRAYSCVLELTHTSGTVTWPSSVRWPNGVAPSLTTGKTHVFVFVTDDGGSTWRGVANTNYTN